MNDKPMIVHVLYRLDTGGMERMLVTLINRTCQRYHHAVICLEGYGALRDEIEPDDVPCLALDKKPGKDWHCYFRLWRALRDLKPDLVHTYNVGAVDAALIARLAGVRRVVHAERGRDAADPRGESGKYRLLRRWLLPFIDRYLAVSMDLQNWLMEKVGIPSSRVVCIPNGIDATAFSATGNERSTRPLLGSFAPPGTVLIGTVGRLDAVKDQAGLITAFRILCEALPHECSRLRLVLLGEGSQRAALESQIASAGLSARVRLLGNRNDVAPLLAEFDVFALSSIAEGMPGVLLEAMASGLPVVATDVGGVGEVVVAGMTGTLVSANDPKALAGALMDYVLDEGLRAEHGAAGRECVMARFSLQTMLSAYTEFYDGLLDRPRHQHEQVVEATRATGHREN